MKNLMMAAWIAFGCLGSAATAQTATPGTPAAEVQTVSGQSAVVTLKTSLSSKGAKEGQPVKAFFRKSVTLAGGGIIAREAELDGVVLKVSKHTKASPNGVLLLKFDSVTEKGKPALPVTVWVAKLNPGGSAAALDEATAKERADQQKAEAEAAKKAPAKTGLPGVFLQISHDGSGTIFALGDDVYLDSGIEMTVLIRPQATDAAAK